MKPLIDYTRYRVLAPIWSLIIWPGWTVYKLNAVKFTGVSLLLWSVSILTTYQHNHEDAVANWMVWGWCLVVILIACGFITKSSRDRE